jgi:soluble lytic murein transglycosylase
MVHRPSARPSSFRSLRQAGLVSACAALTCLTCNAEATPPATSEGAAIVTPSQHGASDAAVARPSDRVLSLRRALVTEGAAVVVARAESEAAASTDPEEAALLRWLAASHDEDPARARERFEALAEGSSVLAPWAALEAARRALEADPARARSLLAPHLAAGSSWVGRAEALAIDALARAAAGDEDAEGHVREALREPPSLGLDRLLRRALADRLAAHEGAAERREAIGLYLDLVSAAPGARTSAGASEAIDALVESFPEEERAALREPSLAQARARAGWLEGSQQHRSASDAHLAIAARLEPGSSERCRALLDAGRALHRGRVHAAAIERLGAMIGECSTLTEVAPQELEARRDALAWAHYSLGRSALSAGQAPLAIVHLLAVAEVAPGHRLADDALVFVARARTERGERAAAHEAFEQAAAAGGDMRGEARFLLAWDLRKAGDGEGALAQLDASLAEGTDEASEGLVGRAAYWRGRVLSELGRSREAADAFEAQVRARPLTYYGQLALARLGELDVARRDAVRADILARRAPLARADLVVTSAAARAVAERLRDGDHARTFERASALLAVGERERGERELRALGVSADGDLATVATLSALLAHHGHPQRATDLARRRLGAVLLAPTDAESLALFRTAYPPAFDGLIEDAASLEEVDPSFVRAVAREESSFDPGATSVSHAYGLLQLIRPTAQRYGRSLGLASDPEALRTPAINVRIGARYMGALRRRYEGQAALVPPAYNAGEGAVDRWIRERPDQPFDAWVEEIPYAETRGYTRRVLQSWVVYAYLDRGELPELPTVLPRRG